MHKHNKKRNVGLVLEFLSRYIAKSIVEKKYENVDKAKKIWAKHFGSNTELSKEFKSYKALTATSLKDNVAAYRLMENVQKDCRKQNQAKLDLEKDALLNEIALLGDPGFFNQEIEGYKTYATIQVVMNAWRGVGFKGNHEDLAQLEEVILQNMKSNENNKNIKKATLTESVLSYTSEDIDGLAFKIMISKFNEKYGNVLSEDQKNIVKNYIFENNKEELKICLSNLRTEILKLVNSKQINESLDSFVNKKLITIKALLSEGKFSNISVIDDEVINFYMTLAKLKEELRSAT